MIVVGCARREERIAELTGNLKGEKGKVCGTWIRGGFSHFIFLAFFP